MVPRGGIKLSSIPIEFVRLLEWRTFQCTHQCTQRLTVMHFLCPDTGSVRRRIAGAVLGRTVSPLSALVYAAGFGRERLKRSGLTSIEAAEGSGLALPGRLRGWCDVCPTPRELRD
jgi:hypothetical protein